MRIILNFALSADGKIGTKSGGPSKFTSQKDLERLWKIRSSADAIIVGRGTLESDSMSMTLPDRPLSSQPKRIVVSKRGKFDYNHPLFHTSGGEIHLISTDGLISDSPNEVMTHQMSLFNFIDYAQDKLNISTLLCEGGGKLAKALADLGIIDEINLTLAGHTYIGGKNAPTLLGQISDHLPNSQHFNLTHFEPLENSECFLTYSKV